MLLHGQTEFTEQLNLSYKINDYDQSFYQLNSSI